MNGIKRMNLSPGIWLTCLPERKFKTSLLSAQLITPLRISTASACALFPAVLRRGTVSAPDMGAISCKLDMLYGASIDYTVRKRGENHCIGFAASFVDDRFLPGQELLLEPVAEMLGEMLCTPVTENGGFVRDYFRSEKENLLDAIRSMINDKRTYADYRLLSEMCAGEAYAVPRLGEERAAEQIQAEQLYQIYQEMLKTCPIELIYCGSAEETRVEAAFRSALSKLPRANVRELTLGQPHEASGEVRRVTETLDVTQGKLSMGFSCTSDDDMAVLLGNTIFGGSSNSRLFLHVREKLSLCYYASSVYHRQKRLITVSAGIEFENYQKACDEILAQLAVTQKGGWEDWEFEGAKRVLLNSYKSLGDSQSAMENFYLSEFASGLNETPRELSEKIMQVTPERVMQAMRSVKLDTVYFLTGKAGDAV